MISPFERIFQEAKGQVGLDHFEVRHYQPLMRHLILSMVSLFFLMQESPLGGQKKSVCSVYHIRRILAVLLDPELSPSVRWRKLERVLQRIVYDQQQAEKARKAHRKARWRQLWNIGIFVSKLRKCFNLF